MWTRTGEQPPQLGGAVATDSKTTETVAGLRALADFLEQNPDVPVWRVDASPFLQGTDEEDRHEVDRIAGVLGVCPSSTVNGYYVVERDFGGGVVYDACAIPSVLMQKYLAVQSYAGRVTP
jgi:hypothetical protein